MVMCKYWQCVNNCVFLYLMHTLNMNICKSNDVDFCVHLTALEHFVLRLRSNMHDHYCSQHSFYVWNVLELVFQMCRDWDFMLYWSTCWTEWNSLLFLNTGGCSITSPVKYMSPLGRYWSTIMYVYPLLNPCDMVSGITWHIATDIPYRYWWKVDLR